MKFKYPVIDSHIHLFDINDLQEIEETAKLGGYEQYTLLSGAMLPFGITGNLAIALAKKKNPRDVYGYASCHMPITKEPDADDLLKQVILYHGAGFDGIKMVDGKPSLRKIRGFSLDDPCYDPMFDYLEKTGMRLLYHSNDPKEFWDKETVPGWALEAGYFYDSSYPTQRQVTEETIGILKKHPKLHMTIAHMFFMSNTDDWELAEELFETYPNLLFDLTPGWEMFEGFGKHMDKWKPFLEKYANRLVYGTDMNGTDDARLLEPLRRALETTDVFVLNDTECHGVNLSDDALRKIYHDTYKTKVQPYAPREIRIELLEDYKNSLMDKYYEDLTGIDIGFSTQADMSREAVTRSIEEYWERLSQ